MKKILTIIVLFYASAAMAQSNPPVASENPPAQAKPQAKAKAPKAKPQSIAVRLQACLEIDDATRDRLDCYDAVFPPKPKPKAPVAKAVTDCRFVKEQDERLTCFNGFVEKLPKLPH